MELVPPQTHSCPGCHTMVLNPQNQNFCTRCGIPLKQPCPHCQHQLRTPDHTFTACTECERNFWACLACGRLYHLDRTSCQNSYCPDRGRFWTRRFGEDIWPRPAGHGSICLESENDEATPTPAWLSESTLKDRRWSSVHSNGLLVSVQETGVLELWSEQGAPSGGDPGDFQETSVCLSRLDLGEDAPCPPLLHQGEVVIPGTTSLSVLEMTANPSVGARLALPERPLSVVDLGDEILVLGQREILLGGLSKPFQTVHESPGELALPLISDHSGGALVVTGDGCYHYAQGELQALENSLSSPEWALYADRFVLVRRNQLAFREGHAFQLKELPEAVIGPPLYCPHNGRLYLLLNDNTIRSCTSTGERFSFVCELAGVPTTVPLKVGERIFYGTEGRYLCRDEEAVRPRLSSQPTGELTYANGRLFGTTLEGGLFSFQI